MPGSQSSKVTADLKRNRLNITISSTADKKEAQKIFTDIRFCVPDLKPGFDIVTDFTHCTVAYLSAISTMQQIMAYLTTHRPGNIVRVVGEMTLVFKQLLRFVTRFQSYTPIYVNTLAEAEELLVNLTKRKGLRFQISGHQVEYTIDQKEGKGHLVDISVSGCAVQGLAMPLSVEQVISIVIPVNHGDDLPSLFTFKAKVIRVEDDLFASQFLDLEETQKEMLYKWFAYEVRQDTSME